MLTITLDRDARSPLFLQIYEAIRQRIGAGRLPAGTALPPSRRLAAELGVARSTVVAAYDQLVAEGYVESRRGAGVFVSVLPETEYTDPRPVAGRQTVPESVLGGPPPFRPGIPDMTRFPYKVWARAVARTARQSPEAMIRAVDPFGDLALRQAIADLARTARGIDTDADRVIITPGALGGLDLILRTLTCPGDCIALEDPGYQAVRAMAAAKGLAPLWLPVDHDGAVVPVSTDDAPDPVAAMLTPSHQFPLGGTMPMARRAAFLNYAARTGTWLIEDDFDSDFRYAGRPIPALSSLDEQGRVLYVGTFAKLFSQSLRIGYVILPPALVDRFRHAVPPFGTGASIVPQRALASFIETGELQRHVRRMRRIYGQRRAAFVTMLRNILGPRVAFDDHPVGMQMVARLVHNGQDHGFGDRAISAAAAKAGIECPPLSDHYAPGNSRGNAQGAAVSGLLMGFAAFESAAMAAPMMTLRTILDAHACGAGSGRRS